MQGKKISTLVFVGVESSQYDSKPRALEMCLVAVQRDHFVDSKVPNPEPRCLNKLRLCFNPQSVISYTCREDTGFTNEELKDQQAFNEDSANLVLLFLKRLPSPVCLLAHNGNGFDFRLLRAELKSVGCVLSDEILCVETHSAFVDLMDEIMPNVGLMKCRRNNFSSSSTCFVDQQFCGNNGNNFPKAINLSTNKGLSQVQTSCIQSTSNFNLNNCVQFGKNDLSQCLVQNLSRNASTSVRDEDEVEVITIKDQKPEMNVLVKENGDKETAIDEFPVIDLTEDSSVDGSSDDEEGEDDEEEEECGDSDDSNIIIEHENETENENPELITNNAIDLQSTSTVVNIPDVTSPSSTKEFIPSEKTVDKNDDETEKKGSNVESLDFSVKNENVDKPNISDDAEIMSVSELNGNVDGNNIKNIPKKRIREDDDNDDDEEASPPTLKKFAVESNNVGNKDDDDKVSSTVLTASSEAEIVSCSSTELTKPKLVIPELVNSSQKTADVTNPKYNISSLHKLLLGHAPVASHSAEENVNALMRIFQVAGSKLCNWIELNAVSLNQIEPMW